MNEKVTKKLLEYKTAYEENNRKKQIIINAIEGIVKIKLSDTDIKIKNNWLIVYTSSVIKKEILLHEKKIVQEILQQGIPIDTIK